MGMTLYFYLLLAWTIYWMNSRIVDDLRCCGVLAVSNTRKISMYKLVMSFTVISDVYMSFIPNKTTFIKYCLSHWVSKLLVSFEIQWVRQYLVNVMDLVGIMSTAVYKAKPVLGMTNCPNFQHFSCDMTVMSGFGSTCSAFWLRRLSWSHSATAISLQLLNSSLVDEAHTVFCEKLAIHI